MGIDKQTEPRHINIVLDDNPGYLKQLREQAEEDGQEGKKLSLTTDKHSFDMEEYYYDETDNEIVISGNMASGKGESWVSISIPLSDIVLIDVIQGALKKLNKLKTALETLK